MLFYRLEYILTAGNMFVLVFFSTFLLSCNPITALEEPGSPIKDINDVINMQHSLCTVSPYCRRQLPKRSVTNATQVSIEKTNCCQHCNCDIKCAIDGTCCPENLAYLPEIEEADLKQKVYCERLQLKPQIFPQTFPISMGSVIMIKKCPDGYAIDDFQKEMKDLCENDVNTNLSTKVPVTHKLTGTSYKNKFCAKCNGLKDNEFLFMDLEVSCIGLNFESTQFDELIGKVLKTTQCNLLYSPPGSLYIQYCVSYISQCNVTGKWGTYDKMVERACAAYTAQFWDYKNMFCFMCNIGPNFNQTEQDCSIGRLEDIGKPSFSAVLQYNPEVANTDSDVDNRKCYGRTLFDPIQEICVEAICLQPNIFLDEQCLPYVKTIGRVGYRVSLTFHPLTNSTPFDLEFVAANIKTWMMQLFNDKGLGGVVYTFTLHYLRKQKNSNAMFLSDIMYYVVYFEFYLFVPEFYSPAYSASSITDIVRLHQQQYDIYSENDDTLKFYIQLEVVDVTEPAGGELSNISLRVWTQVDSAMTMVTLDRDARMQDAYPDKSIIGNYNRTQLIYMTPLMSCPLLYMNTSYYNITFHPWGVFIARYPTYLNKSEYVADDNGQKDIVYIPGIRVCNRTLYDIKARYSNSAPLLRNVGVFIFIIGFVFTIVFV